MKKFILNLFAPDIKRLLSIQRDKCAAAAEKFYNDSTTKPYSHNNMFNRVNQIPLIDINEWIK